jgi:hypothetical protein
VQRLLLDAGRASQLGLPRAGYVPLRESYKISAGVGQCSGVTPEHKSSGIECVVQRSLDVAGRRRAQAVVRLWYSARLLALFVIVGEFAGATTAFDVLKVVAAPVFWVVVVLAVARRSRTKGAFAEAFRSRQFVR